MRTLSLSLVLLALTACGTAEPDGTPAAAPQAAAEAYDDLAKQAAMISRELRASPDDAEAILAKHSLSAEAFEAMLFKVAADPDLSKRYNEAVR